MTVVPIRHVRADLAAAVRRARAGERIVISVGGQPAAQLGPLEPTGDDRVLSLDDLVSHGLIEAPRRTTAPVEREPVPVWSGARLDRLLRELRG
jgi:prevent-host-death family protein